MTTTSVPRPRRKNRPADTEQITLSLRLPGLVYNAVADLSDEERRSVNSQIVVMLERQLGINAPEPKP